MEGNTLSASAHSSSFQAVLPRSKVREAELVDEARGQPVGERPKRRPLGLWHVSRCEPQHGVTLLQNVRRGEPLPCPR